MSVLIKDMEIPNNCCGCEFSDYTPTGSIPYCRRTRKDLAADVYFNKRDSDCPLLPVPPHGRLIDADALDSSETDYLGNHFVYLVDIDDAPTIIPASEEEMQ